MKVPKFSTGELFLVQVIVWLAIWLASEFMATLLTLSIGAVVSAVLLIALIAEWIEPSKVPGAYFRVMASALLAIVLAAAVYYGLFSASFNPFGR